MAARTMRTKRKGLENFILPPVWGVGGVGQGRGGAGIGVKPGVGAGVDADGIDLGSLCPTEGIGGGKDVAQAEEDEDGLDAVFHLSN